MPAFGKIGRVGSFAAGVTNRKEPVNLIQYDQQGNPSTVLIKADNVDIHPDGYLKRRQGYTRLVEGLSHSLWGDDKGGFVVSGGKLCALAFNEHTKSLATREVMPYAGLKPISYARAPTGDVYWSNGDVLRRVTAQGEDAPATTPTPNPAPSVQVTAGSLPAGRYLVAFTRMGDSESPATHPLSLDLPADSGLSFTGMAADVVAYVSELNGEVLTDAQGARCQTIGMSAMPAGQIVRVHMGRLLVASGDTLWFSEPYFYGLANPIANFIQFPSRITVLEVLDDGLFVCADQTYWLAGDVASAEAGLKTIAPFGGIEGSGSFMRDREAVFWASPRGLVVGTPDGKVDTVQAHAITFGGADRAACLHREQDGQSQCVFTEIEPKPAIGATRSHPTFHQGKK